MSQKMRNVLKRIFEFIFVRFLVFKMWSILYSIVVYSEVGTANVVQTLTSEVGDSIQKHPRAPGGGCQGPSHQQRRGV